MRWFMVFGAVLMSSIIFGWQGFAEEPEVGKRPSLFEGRHVLVLQHRNVSRFSAYGKSSITGKWQHHVFPKDVIAVPVLAGEVCVFSLSGDQVSEFVAIDREGNWSTYRLPRPIKGKFDPIVSATMGVYVLPDRILAFSALTGSWDSLPGGGTPRLSNDFAVVERVDLVAAFSAKTGSWSTVELNGGAD